MLQSKAEHTMSQTIRALIRLRELILNRELGLGERLLEVPMADRLGASRTPIRAALARLTEEGLLEKMPGGGVGSEPHLYPPD